MYVPPVNALADRDEIEAFVRTIGAADWVTVAPDGVLESTLLPVLWEGERLIAHLARANEHWKHIADGAAGLAIVHGPQAYVSPGWYASKAEHGRVVPTWNYTAVHLTGTVTVHDDPDWVRGMVTDLTARHESERQQPWAVTDAPERFVAGQLRAIVGLEMHVTRVEAKAKLSQNRSEADRAGVVAGLRAEAGGDAQAVADAMSTGLRHQDRGS